MTFAKTLTPAEIAHIRDNKTTLLSIQSATDVPWQAMAGIWYRESFSVTPPKRVGGSWQFDPPPTDWSIHSLLDRFTLFPQDMKNQIVAKGINDFYAGGVIAACWFRTKTARVVHAGADDSTIKDAIWGYNGKKYGSADRSPYVMNGFDAAHYPMREIGTVPDGHGGRVHIDQLDHQLGAFTVYKQLLELKV